MKNYIFLLLFLTVSLSAQESNYYVKKGFVIEGYDVVSYFKDSEPKEGKKKYQYTNDGVKYLFSSVENLEFFKAHPEKYIPQYGGYCAYAVALKHKKVSVNPETYEVRNGKLYLFYNSWGTNTLDLWLNEDVKELVVKGDKNWKSLRSN